MSSSITSRPRLRQFICRSICSTAKKSANSFASFATPQNVPKPAPTSTSVPSGPDSECNIRGFWHTTARVFSYASMLRRQGIFFRPKMRSFYAFFVIIRQDGLRGPRRHEQSSAVAATTELQLILSKNKCPMGPSTGRTWHTYKLISAR